MKNLTKYLSVILSLILFSAITDVKPVSFKKHILPMVGAAYAAQDIAFHVIPAHFAKLKSNYKHLDKFASDRSKSNFKKEVVETVHCLTFDTLVLSIAYYLYKGN